VNRIALSARQHPFHCPLRDEERANACRIVRQYVGRGELHERTQVRALAL
jgi:hypothetical protein